MTLREWQKRVHENAKAKGWWPAEGRNTGELLMLVVSEVSEALEEYRAGRMRRWFNPNHKFKPEGFPIELADAVIRIFDMCEALGIDLEEAIEIKHAYNETRPFRHGGESSMTASEGVGFAALSVSLVGHVLAAHGSPNGWRLRLASGPLWMATAIMAGHVAYIVTGVIYTAIDLYGCWRRR